MADPKRISAAEVAQHCSASDCWVVINDEIWDVTEFAPEHPGGSGAILRYAGQDASQAYNEVHTPDLISKTLTTDKLIGHLDQSSSPTKPHNNSVREAAPPPNKSPLSTILSAHDFESVAQDTFSKKAWTFYSSAATDLVSDNANRSLYNRIWFRPRLLRNVRDISTKCTVQGVDCALPVIVAPVALASLANPIGEKGLARAAASRGIFHCIPITASISIEDITSDIQSPSTVFFFQLYVAKDRTASESLLRRVWKLGIRTLFVTIDAPVAGKREADEKVKAQEMISMPMTGTRSKNDEAGSGLTRTTGSFIDSSFCWEDLSWVKKHWPGKIVIKGLQSVEDAQMAVEVGVSGIILSNHGGRNLDTSPPGLLTLLELRRHLPSIFSQLEVYIDGGIRRGTDILKALCLGAKAVLIGRPFLYSLAYGEDGPKHLVDILQAELETAMKLVGITDLSQANSALVNTQDLDHLVVRDVGITDVIEVPRAKI
ncbi:cytochrome B2 [Aspergillus vadensis CBS 113365]|uniref:L-lactate dehydrogenase (cytochrome) n=1 Tax=Aspergillus vadensis (strain CBS 113365 / IMI 142717 / IBT 24658) TaxID=1448311 RepID=A0A319B6B4_ASPVC|nr:cytochrome B2 [Aspergillus vadensis CBS 113365]PYH67354.1 cytochrome B2 [Aspergillus vadensis CBS 113365]